MKKSTLLVGVASTVLLLIGIGMKTMHWPGAGVVMTVSLVTFGLGYALLLFLDKNKGTQTGIDKLSNIMAMLTMMIVSVGFLFKIQHWSGAGILIYAAHAFLILMIIVLYIQGSKESDNVKKLYINNSAIILTLMTAISLYIWWRTRAPGSL
jgi:hypothetical protein